MTLWKALSATIITMMLLCLSTTHSYHNSYRFPSDIGCISNNTRTYIVPCGYIISIFLCRMFWISPSVKLESAIRNQNTSPSASEISNHYHCKILNGRIFVLYIHSTCSQVYQCAETLAYTLTRGTSRAVQSGPIQVRKRVKL